jgi:hypothetical protein
VPPAPLAQHDHDGRVRDQAATGIAPSTNASVTRLFMSGSSTPNAEQRRATVVSAKAATSRISSHSKKCLGARYASNGRAPYNRPVISELDVLHIVGERLESAGLAFMLTGSFAMAYYATPRMTRDIDLVVALQDGDVDRVVMAFAGDFYIDADDVRAAVRSQRLFNLMHLASGIKVDLIVRKDSEYRHVEFARRKPVTIAGIATWIVSREDLILSKLIWAAEADSDLQRRDARSLLDGGADDAYLNEWAPRLGVAETLGRLR